jgi:hypothetical protein
VVNFCPTIEAAMRTVRALLLPLIVLLALLSSAGQTPPVQEAHVLLANVLDQKGRSIRDLTKEKFRVKVNGKAAEVIESNSFASKLAV